VVLEAQQGSPPPEAREEFFKMLHDLGGNWRQDDFFDHEAKK